MPAPNFANRTLYHGDNLDFLRGMNSGTVHLIATDPPFNKGRDFHATPDSLASGAKFQDRWSWADDVEGEWVDQIQDDWPAVWFVIDAAAVAWGDDMAAFLCFMGVRLIEMRRVLRDDGSLYLHCDPTASHYLKALLDAVFGRRQFRSEVVWKRSGGKSDAYRWAPTTDRVLFYSKSSHHIWNQQYQPHDPGYVEQTYRHDDNDGRGPYTTMPVHAAGLRSGESGLPWNGYQPSTKGRHWATPVRGAMHKYILENELIHGWPDAFPRVNDRLDALNDASLITTPDDKRSLPRLKTYLSATRGVAATDLVLDVPMASGRERVGYPTQKPLPLYERIIKASSNEGDIVLDPFAGCATTPIAAERLGRQWVAMDIWEGALDIVRQRMADNRQLLTDADPQIHYVTEPPERTDDGIEAVPFLQVTERIPEPDDVYYSNAAKREHLLRQHGPRCQGCDRSFDDPRYLELDHNTPRSDGGLNHITNRILLCGPCNRLKSNQFTLSGLRRQNAKLGFMAAGG